MLMGVPMYAYACTYTQRRAHVLSHAHNHAPIDTHTTDRQSYPQTVRKKDRNTHTQSPKHTNVRNMKVFRCPQANTEGRSMCTWTFAYQAKGGNTIEPLSRSKRGFVFARWQLVVLIPVNSKCRHRDRQAQTDTHTDRDTDKGKGNRCSHSHRSTKIKAQRQTQ